MNNKVVLVTGSSVGIGAKTIEKFAKEGYNVVINYVNHEKEAYDLKNNVEEKYNIEALVIKCDITNEEDIKYMFNSIISKFNRIDVLVNNAGIDISSSLEEKTKSTYMKVLETNLVGTFLVNRIFGDYMFDKRNGCIINISSNNAIDSYNINSLEYDSSKAGIINLSHNLANNYAPYVRVNTICPGWTNTTPIKEMNPNFKEIEQKRILLNRFAEPNEIANVIYFVSTEEASFINDSVIKVDGGIRC